MGHPDIETLRVWASWDMSKVPRFSIWDYKVHIEQPEDRYVFQERKTKRIMKLSIGQITLAMQLGSFRPFVLVTPTETPFQAG